ncbi:MAG TPA: MarR family transcriptional regulator [Ilumatobacter sp.]|nr:MarR family transcriptional regulator [Ilumatobacter sp.]
MEERDAVDRILDEWQSERPDLDMSPVAVVGRISRLSRLFDRALSANFAAHGIEDWMYDVLATLRRIGAPHELTPRELIRSTMVTTGAITNRIDRLEERGLVERSPSTTDRRSVVVRLTPAGRDLVDQVVTSHLEVEHRLLAVLSPRERELLAATLRTLAIDAGDLA